LEAVPVVAFGLGQDGVAPFADRALAFDSGLDRWEQLRADIFV
jgi:hypothetical protein